MPTSSVVVDAMQSMSDLGLIGAPKVSKAVIDIYIAALDGVTDEEFTGAIGEHLRTSKFFPKPAELVSLAQVRAERVRKFWAQTFGANPTFAMREMERETNGQVHDAITSD